MDLFKNKTVVVLGGTGFLGRALVKRILEEDPQSVRVFSRDEFKHHKVQELFNYHPKLRNLIGDIRDYSRLKKALRGADIVIHAAALKRIDILEFNVEESIKTNIVGTLNVVKACWENNVEKVIFISSDKACSPINTYGACKFVGERIFTESNFNKGDKRTMFFSVRYGNVLESTGSVIPFFESKIKNGEEIPLTDPRMTRFIISPDQAVDLVFNAIRYGTGGEVFVPILPSFKIIDLIEILKEKHNASNNIQIIGIRPGEKVHEAMVNEMEKERTFKFKDMYVITSAIEDYVEDLGEREYHKEENKVPKEEVEEYNSKGTLLNKEEIFKLFRELKLL